MGQDLITTLVIIVRWLVLGVCLWNVFWSFGGLIEMARGTQNIPQTVRAAVFWGSVAGVISSGFVLFFGTDTVFASPMLLSLMCFLVHEILFAWMVRRWRKDGLQKYDGLMERPDLALPLVELAHLDEQAAQDLANQARMLLAQKTMGL